MRKHHVKHHRAKHSSGISMPRVSSAVDQLGHKTPFSKEKGQFKGMVSLLESQKKQRVRSVLESAGA